MTESQYDEAASDALMQDLRTQMEAISSAARKRAELTASASVESGRITVTVNADGVLIDVDFSTDIEDLDYKQIAKAVVTATQEAAATVQREAAATIAAVADPGRRSRTLSDMLEGMPDIQDMLPESGPAPMTSPEERRRAAEAAAAGEVRPVMEFTDVEQPEELRRGDISARDW